MLATPIASNQGPPQNSSPSPHTNAAAKTPHIARFITTGAKRGDQIAIVKGLSADDQVVTAGQMKLRNGAPVIINNSILPANSPTPTPAQS